MSGNVCRYCFAPIADFAEPEPIIKQRWVRGEQWSESHWEQYDARIPLMFCTDRHRRAALGNRDARSAAVDECRDDDGDDTPEPPMFDPNQTGMF